MNEMTLGTVRVDRIGRMVLPVAARKALGLQPDELMEASLDRESGVVTLRRADCHCMICDGRTDLKTYRGLTLCMNCLQHLEREGAARCEQR